MKEFMLFIKSEGNPIANFSPEQQQEHIQKVGGFIKKMMESGHMKSAQPLEMEGSIVSFKKGKHIDGPFNETKEIISGYYHLLAKDLNEAVAIWKIEVRPVMNVDGIN